MCSYFSSWPHLVRGLTVSLKEQNKPGCGQGLVPQSLLAQCEAGHGDIQRQLVDKTCVGLTSSISTIPQILQENSSCSQLQPLPGAVSTPGTRVPVTDWDVSSLSLQQLHPLFPYWREFKFSYTVSKVLLFEQIRVFQVFLITGQGFWADGSDGSDGSGWKVSFKFSQYLFYERAARTGCVMWDSPKPSTGVKSLALHTIFLIFSSKNQMSVSTCVCPAWCAGCKGVQPLSAWR